MWYNPIENPPPENKDVLIYSDSDKMLVARFLRGHWTTYMKVIGWQELPKDKPKKESKK